MQAGQCGSQMSTKFWEVVCDEHGIGGGGDYFGDNDAQIDRINDFYHETSGGKYVSRTVLMGLGPGVIDTARARPTTLTLRRYVAARIHLPLFT
jgi:tubulin beta